MPNIHDAVTGEGAAPVVILDGSGTQITSFGSGAITSVVPGTAATNLGKAIDTAAGATDTGVALLGVRDDALSAITPAEGDWAQVRVDVNGALWVQLAGALAATTDGVYSGANVTGGYTPFKLLDIDETEDEIKATAGKVGGWVLTNLHTATVFVKFYNATAANVTVGSTAPTVTVAVPASTGIVMPLGGPGIAFGTAICVAATLDEADADATAIPSANLVVGTVFYV